ncbi:hypothetical protein K2173_005334 [Erythroxylum novogranatense]|uniref:F-box domain-containing protein n=1 Tax=Erythroxylum novogranatense TaxID=1862640 RepID=A0AAV8TIX7_9ROSI|nr:hypothetical protein K2173_005334 [Erythroxylum novogranatense]
MDDLPPPLIIEILSRLADSTDLARCRVASKSLNALSREVRSINLFCTLPRYFHSRSQESTSAITSFKAVFNALVNNSRSVESVSIGVDKSLAGISYDDVDDESDDLYLTDVMFVKEWLPRVCGDLRSLSISDFWVQSCWRKSDILALISLYCQDLLRLEVKNAWLSVDGLNPIPKLTSLTLEFIRLDDEDLTQVNYCFPGLQVLNLIGVGGLKEPKINLLCLKKCYWTVSNAPLSLAIFAPNLVELKLKCVKPKSLVLETAQLCNLYLSLEKANNMEIKEFRSLENLKLQSANLSALISSFPSNSKITKLVVDSLKVIHPNELMKLSLEGLFDAFPNTRSLVVGSLAWSEMETCFSTSGFRRRVGMTSLKELSAQLVLQDSNVTWWFISCILDECVNLSDVSLLFHHGVDRQSASALIGRCMARQPGVKWRLVMQKEGTEHTWISDGF